VSTQAITIPHAKNFSLPGMLFLSILGHVLVFAIVFAFPYIFPSHHPEPFGGPSGGGGNVVWGNLNVGSPGKPAPPKVTQEEPAPPKTISKLHEEEQPLDSKTELPAPKPKKEKMATAKQTLNQKERTDVGPNGRGKDTSGAAKQGNGGPGKFGVGTFGTGQGGPGGIGTGTGVQFPFPWYIESVMTKIEINWFKPAIADSQEHVAVVYFEITRAGQVTNLKVEQSSGIPALDRSAENAVLGAEPFPPLPNQWTEPMLSFRLNFNYTH
jgi:periplasmic protein TonB